MIAGALLKRQVGPRRNPRYAVQNIGWIAFFFVAILTASTPSISLPEDVSSIGSVTATRGPGTSGVPATRIGRTSLARNA